MACPYSKANCTKNSDKYLFIIIEVTLSFVNLYYSIYCNNISIFIEYYSKLKNFFNK